MGSYRSLNSLNAALAEALKPPERISVSSAAEKYRRINNPGSYVGPWDNSFTPYLTEYMDVLNSTDFLGAVFVGPAQTGKTDVLFNWILHGVLCDPMDLMVVQTSTKTAGDFSETKLAKFNRHNKEVNDRLIKRRDQDKVLSKTYQNGMRVSMSWPSINELSGKSIPHVWITDYDRMPEDIDGEGTPYDTGAKRTQSFKRFGMTVAESTPGWPVEDPKWIRDSPHQAPPAKGILSLYNRGDRRRWYWQCQNDKCRTYWEPNFKDLGYPEDVEPSEAGKKAVMLCPCCGHVHEPKDKRTLNSSGKWLKEGQTIDKEGNIKGRGRQSSIASFWLMGVCAAFADWSVLVENFINAEREYNETGDQEALKVTTNVDQGMPYIPKGLAEGRLPEMLKDRSEDLGEKEVPAAVRWLQATVDVQKNRFEVQVQGTAKGGDKYIIDRFAIHKSKRLDEDGDPMPIRPHAYLEDWDVLIDQVITKSYPLSDGSGRRMGIKISGCDSGGKDGVHTNAYDFWRRLRDDPDLDSLHLRFLLVRGASYDSAPRIQIRYPDAEVKDRKAAARGDVPVLFINGTIVKDQLNNKLDIETPGSGMYHFPDWLEDWFYREMTAEIRGTKRWENPKKARNEAWDLLQYDIALSLTRFVRIEHLDWDKPPSWAAEWDENDFVFTPDSEISAGFAPKKRPAYALDEIAKLAETLNG